MRLCERRTNSIDEMLNMTGTLRAERCLRVLIQACIR
jgi:hypothetical protein